MTLFITGISTGVGKTLASAIAVQALKSDYWKPVQSGDLHQTDSMEVKRLLSFPAVIYPEAYRLNTPASPHLSAQIDGIEIDVEILAKRPSQNLVIEGAGGILVPLNDTHTMLDLIQPKDKVLVVSQNYLGSINHTMLTIMALEQKVGKRNIAVLFNGDENPSTQSYILNSGVTGIGRIDANIQVSPETVERYAQLFADKLKSFVCQ